MGKRRGAYQEDFPVGTWVKIVDQAALEKFRQEWRWHHPLEPGQLAFAGREGQVTNVSFYHGGDELYKLEGIPGTWHEQCLNPLDE
jgi:hypothetical protein